MYKALIIYFFIGAFLISCGNEAILDDNVSIPDYNWDLNNILHLEAEIPDTITSYNVYLNVRNGSNYPYSNLFLFLTTYAPKGELARDTVEILLADERGKWLGSGSGNVRDSRVLFKRNFRFPQAGKWRFEIQQAMRMNPLPQIMDAGMRIEKAGNP